MQLILVIDMLEKKRLKHFRPPVPGNNDKFWIKAMIYHYCYNTLVFLIGAGFIIWGGWMVINGVKGNVNWILELLGNKSKLVNATPGLFLMVVGFLIIILGKSDTTANENNH